MEAHTQTQQRQPNKAPMKKSSSRNSDCSSTHMESPHSPLRFHSPLRSELGDPPESPPYESPENSLERPVENSRAIVAVDRFTQYSPLPSPADRQKPLENAKLPSPVVVFNRSRREEPPPSVTKVGPSVGEEGRGSGMMASNQRRSKREEMDQMVNKAALGFRLSEFVLCLVSFAVMGADKTQGWSGDSFDRYKEYRSLSLSILLCVRACMGLS